MAGILRARLARALDLVTVFALAAIVALAAFGWSGFQRYYVDGVKLLAATAPDEAERPAILVFSKTRGYRHDDAIPAANDLFARFAREQGWDYFQTENAANFTPEMLARFDAVVFNNVSGDVFTPQQREAFRAYVEGGGGFVGFHGSGGDNEYAWRWYVDELIGAQFIGHPMAPQFQSGRLVPEGGDHPATAGLPPHWFWIDEFYSFEASPRAKGYDILLTIDEESYAPERLAMGSDHPMAWWHCQGGGRAFYSALGHRPESYAEPEYQAMLLGATRWALRLEGGGCEQ